MERWPSSSTRRLAALGLAGMIVLAGEAWAGSDATLRFARRGEPIAARDLSRLKQAVDPTSVVVFEPYEETEVRFEAIPLAGVLDAIYTPSWRQEEEILFTCRDGYQPSIPVARVVEHRAWLAYDREPSLARDPDAGKAQQRFSILKRESGRRQWIDLSPWYLIWENLEDEVIRRDADYGWPYQLVGIDLIRFRDRFPLMLPPDDASGDAIAGMTAFRVHCGRCHAINGQGGTIGQELNAPVNATEVRSLAWLRSWIDDPGQIRSGTRMPRLNPALPNRDRTIEQILAYLSAMKHAKRDGTAITEKTDAP